MLYNLYLIKYIYIYINIYTYIIYIYIYIYIYMIYVYTKCKKYINPSYIDIGIPIGYISI